ncbi:hypothetical protein [Chryseobacterium vaccae]|uniref:hypothetical protein n=1 Tax=Chryseobacterium vaccae TaxID=2604424 RepID=UPI001297E491|nr:hypothetical protein [Chryseobacterium vaccae]
MKTKITEIVQGIKKKHVNDPTVSTDKDLISELMLSDVSGAITALNELDLDTLEWISSRFEAISYQLQNKEWVEGLKRLLIKFPDSQTLKEDIHDAVEAYYGDEGLKNSVLPKTD